MIRVFSAIPFIFVFASCVNSIGVSPQALAFEIQCIQSLESGDYEGAKTRCELCLEYDETVAECMNGLGLVAFAKGETDVAIEKFTYAVHLNPSLGQARNNLGVIYFKQEKYSYALPLFLAAVQIDPGYVDARYNAGLCYLRMGRKSMSENRNEAAGEEFGLAQEQYKKVVALNPKFSNAYRDMGLVMTYLHALDSENRREPHQLRAANAYFRQCLELEKDDPDCMSGLRSSQNLLTSLSRQ